MDKTFILKNDLTEIKRLTDILCKLCEDNNICNKVLCDVALALEEIFANIVHYAYGDPEEHLVKIHIKIHDNLLSINITDDGKPFNPLEVPKTSTEAALEDREIGGLGIHLVRHLIDKLEYKQVKGKNVLTMKVRLQ
jgi:anti-sigma regulatory factor (Ser/Thr protein kinase)